MVKLKLKRIGKKFDPHYRIVAIQARTKREGKALEELGSYSPIAKTLTLKNDRIEYWLKVGAQPTPTVERLLIKEKLMSEPAKKRTFKNEPKRKSVERKAAKEEAKKAPKEEAPVVEEAVEETKAEEVKDEVVEVKADETTEKASE